MGNRSKLNWGSMCVINLGCIIVWVN